MPSRHAAALSRRGTLPCFLALAALLALLAGVAPRTFVGPAAGCQRRPQRSLRQVSTAGEVTTKGGKGDAAAATAGEGDGAVPAAKDAQIDDAVLKMAMAMAEEEEKDGVKPIDKTAQEKEGGFDFNIIIQAFWSFLILYSFGSCIIGISQGRIQDRTGGDFTPYDFFDNIFAFKEWSWETTLGVNPVEAVQGLLSKGAPAAADPAALATAAADAVPAVPVP